MPRKAKDKKIWLLYYIDTINNLCQKALSNSKNLKHWSCNINIFKLYFIFLLFSLVTQFKINWKTLVSKKIDKTFLKTQLLKNINIYTIYIFNHYT